MMPLYEPYTTTITGPLRTDRNVSVIDISRADWDGIVNAAFEELSGFSHFKDSSVLDRLREQLEPVTSTITRFPLGEWMTSRGCGCVVGEFLAEALNYRREEICDWSFTDVQNASRRFDGSDGLYHFSMKVDVTAYEFVRELNLGEVVSVLNIMDAA